MSPPYGFYILIVLTPSIHDRRLCICSEMNLVRVFPHNHHVQEPDKKKGYDSCSRELAFTTSPRPLSRAHCGRGTHPTFVCTSLSTCLPNSDHPILSLEGLRTGFGQTIKAWKACIGNEDEDLNVCSSVVLSPKQNNSSVRDRIYSPRAQSC